MQPNRAHIVPHPTHLFFVTIYFSIFYVCFVFYFVSLLEIVKLFLISIFFVLNFGFWLYPYYIYFVKVFFQLFL